MLPALLWVALSVSPEAAREAKEFTRHSMTEYDTGQFEKSLEDATHAFELDPLPAFLFNVAQCHRAQHHWEKAEFFYRRYLAHVPKARNRKTVEALIAAVQIRQGKSPDVSAPQLPDLSPAPLVSATPGQPPSVATEAPSTGDLEQATAKAAPGLMQDVEVYPPVVVVREDLDSGAPNPTRAWAWGTTWLAVGLAAVGAGVGIGNVVATNGVAGTPRPIVPSQESSVSSQLGLAQGLGITADALFIGAGVSAVAALTLFLVSRNHGATASVSVGPAPAGLGLGASGRF